MERLKFFKVLRSRRNIDEGVSRGTKLERNADIAEVEGRVREAGGSVKGLSEAELHRYIDGATTALRAHWSMRVSHGNRHGHVQYTLLCLLLMVVVVYLVPEFRVLLALCPCAHNSTSIISCSLWPTCP